MKDFFSKSLPNDLLFGCEDFFIVAYLFSSFSKFVLIFSLGLFVASGVNDPKKDDI